MNPINPITPITQKPNNSITKIVLLLIFFMCAISYGVAYGGQLLFDGVPVDITTTANEDLVIAPGTGGNTQIGTGTGTNTHATSNNDLHITGILETDSAAYFDSGVTLGDSTSDTITLTGYLGSHLIPATDSTYDLGSSTLAWRYIYVDIITGYGANLALNPASGYSLTGSVTKNAATGNEVAYDLAATINKATSGNYTGLKLNVTETSAPGADDRLLDLQVGGASMFRVDNSGNVTAAGTISGAAFDLTGTTANTFTINNDGTAVTSELALGAVGTTGGKISTGAGNLLIDSAGGTIDIDDGTIDLSTQAVAVTLNNAANALNFDSNTLSIDALSNLVGIGTASPGARLESTVANTDNAIGIIVDQDDVTNNPVALQVENAGTGNGIFVQQAGNGISINIDSEATTADLLALDGSVLTTGNLIQGTVTDTLTTDTALINVTGTALNTATNVTLYELSTTAINDVDVTAFKIERGEFDARIVFDEGEDAWKLDQGAGAGLVNITTGASAAPIDATYITQTSNATLSAEQALGSLATGILKNTITTGVLTIAAQGTDYYAPSGTDVAVADGGTGVGSWTNGQLLIGNTTGNTAALATLTGTANQVVVANGASSITLSTPQDIGTSSAPQFARLGLGAAADAANILTATSASTTNLSKAANVTHTGIITGTGYAGYFSTTGASTTNVGLYATASGATSDNWAGYFTGKIRVDSTEESVFSSDSSRSTYLHIQPVTVSDTSGHVRIGAYDLNGSTGARDLSLNPSGGTIFINDNKLSLRGTADTNHYIQYDSGVDGPRIAGWTGIEFYKSNGSVQLGTWDSSKLYVAGNVGIGTTTPNIGTFSTGLEISGASGAIALTSTSASKRFIIGVAVPAGLYFRDHTAGAYRMTINSGGDVGIGTITPNTTLHVNGGISVGVVSKSTDYTMTTSNFAIFATGGVAGITITLPAATNTGMVIHLKKVDSGVGGVTVSRAGTDTIEGGASVSLAAQYSGVTLIADGTSTWYKISSL